MSPTSAFRRAAVLAACLVVLAAGPAAASSLDLLDALGIRLDCGTSECVESQISLELGDGGFSLALDGGSIRIDGALSYSTLRLAGALDPLQTAGRGTDVTLVSGDLDGLLHEGSSLLLRPIYDGSIFVARVLPGPVSAAPEPSAALVFATGLGVAALRLRRHPAPRA